MPRLVRRRPLRERVLAMLNPMDLLLWLSEEMETRDWDSQLVGTQLGLGLNFSLLLARANSASTTPMFNDDLFGDTGGSRWLYLMVWPLVWALGALSLTNAVYAFYRTRKYRLFQASVDTQPATPSARRVKVHSSPASSSPLRFLADMVTPQSAESRAHPNNDTDVWELAVWDPLTLSMRLLCFFSPGHVLVYWLFLPLAPLDPRPSMTVFNSLVMQVVLSVQMLMLCARFTRQAKDNNIIQKEVMREYDAKFVHPRLYPVVRDVGTQVSEDEPAETPGSVQLGTPTTLLRRGFKTHGNPHVDSPDSPLVGGLMRPQMFTPPPASRRAEASPSSVGFRGPAVRSTLPSAPSPHVEAGPLPGGGFNFGGMFGVYTHSKSPLKKTISQSDLASQPLPKTSREMAAYEQLGRGPSRSPAKQSKDSRTASGQAASQPLSNTGSDWDGAVSIDGHSQGAGQGRRAGAPEGHIAFAEHCSPVSACTGVRKKLVATNDLFLVAGRVHPAANERDRKPSIATADVPRTKAAVVPAGGVEAKQPDNKIRRHITSSCRRSSQGHGPDQILRWNMAQDLPKGAQPETARPRVAAGPSSRHQAVTRKESHRVSRPEPVVEKRHVQTMEERREARRQRRTLKESGDYLGVQGINPATGQLDIMTPTDSDGSSEKQQKLNVLRAALRDARQSYRDVKAQSEREARRILDSEARKLRRLEKEKQKLQKLSQRVRWQRQTKQWSSAQEPELSPIVGSRRGSSAQAGRLSRHQHPDVMSRVAVDLGRQPRDHYDTPDSTRTVVRTPQRQSLATPSAWELFANGITFDNSEPAAESFLGSGAELGRVDTGETMMNSSTIIPGPRQRNNETKQGQSLRPAARSTLRRLMTPLENLKAAKRNEAQLSAGVVQPRCQQRGPAAEAERPAVVQPVGLTTGQLHPLSSAQLGPQTMLDDEWMERALKDLADTGDRYTKEPASTRITTTTGFDQVISMSIQAEGGEAARRQQSSILCNLSESRFLDDNDDSSSSTTMKTTQNTSPSSTPAPSGEVTDTTSVVTEQRHSTSLKSTSSQQTMMHGDDHGSGDGRDGSHEANRQTVTHQQQPGQTTTGQQLAAASKKTTEAPTRWQASDERSALDMELCLLTARMPGTFPAETEGGRESEDGKSWRWLKKTIARAATSLPQLYWTTVTPVIDWRSDYWARAERNEMTLLDGVALVLAMPAALMAMVGLA
ncbi:hypothetical protein L249_8922 [Ophiocordyceps polyrhachis-furcata BCC 54312]|uniref:Uncharacterized protein n=1 Tax=Ophiocordyceps polyrhachis-furcata BCC 54312 TaxID=1330021 RepID=A0A367L284_9HYPO|nr:hypothetical protein L249_8922 [Ophiocordyceps polyrhachis-furcata BCC 54312]